VKYAKQRMAADMSEAAENKHKNNTQGRPEQRKGYVDFKFDQNVLDFVYFLLSIYN